MALIELDHISKSFRIPNEQRRTIREHVLGLFRRREFEELRVLDDVSLELRSGETLGIMGRNGSGKSTLLKILCGIYQPDRGRVTVRGAITPLLELGIGWNPELDAVDNILLLGTVMGMRLEDARRSIDEVLAFAELERFRNLELKHFSSGMASRLAYSVAFRAVSEVLVIDEIFAVGDAGFKQRCEERYMQLSAAGHSTIIVSHDPQVVERFCRRAVLLERGRVILEDTGENVARAYLETTRPGKELEKL